MPRNKENNEAKISEQTIAKSKKAKEELERINHRIADFLGSIPESFYVLDFDWNFVYVNKIAADTIGKKPEDLIGKNYWKLYPKQLGTAAEENFRWTMEKREIRKFEFHSLYLGIWSQVTVTPTAEGISILATNITDRKKAEEELVQTSEREHFLAQLIRDASVAVGVGYSDGRLGLVNDAFEKLTGYSREELQKINWNNILTPSEYREYENAKLAEVNQTKKPIRYEKEYTRKNGSRVPIELTVHPFLDKDGNVTSYFSFITDITDRKKAEEAFSKNQDELQTIIDSSQGLIFYKDRENYFVRVNKAFAEIMGLPKEQLEGRSLFEVYPKEEAEAFWNDDKQVFASGKAKVGIEEKMLSKQGQRWVQTDKIPYRDAEGNIIGVIGFSLDITERKRAEEALKDSGERLQHALEAGELGLWG